MSDSTDLTGIAERALDRSDRLLTALRERIIERTIRGRPLATNQSVAHTFVDHWVVAAAVRAALTRAPHAQSTRSAIALGATQGLLGLCDDAMRLRGGNGYLAADIAADSRNAALHLARALGDPNELAAALGRTDEAIGRTSAEVDTAVAATLDGIWDDAAALHADTSGVLHDAAVHQAVVGAGWLGVFVAHARLDPRVGTQQSFAIAEALALRGIPIYGLNTTAMAAAQIRDHGCDRLRANVLPRLLAGDEICALGYTEPDAGSDLAALRTTATARDDSWVLDGTKRFCTLADVASHILVLARSDPSSERSRGLTLFAVPTSAKGIDIRPLPTHGGEVTTELRLESVEVTPDHVVGEVGGGWSVVMSALRYERNAAAWCDAVRLLRRARALGAYEVDGAQLASRTHWQVDVGWLIVDLILGRGLVDELLADESSIAAVAPSAVKLFTTESLVQSAGRFATSIPTRLQSSGPAVGIESMWRRSVSLTIAGGASEVQRDIIAAHLGLPRPN